MGLAIVAIVSLWAGLVAISVGLRAPSGESLGSNAIVQSPGSAGDGGSLGAPAPNETAESASPNPTGVGGSPESRSTPPLTAGHVWWIILENHEYGSIIGSQQAPYFNALAGQYGLATDYYGTSHPSEPNYIALVAGSTLGVASDGVYQLRAPSIFSELAAAGRTWRVYAQDDQPGCFTGTTAGGGADGPGAPGIYARKHNPAISFVSVAGSQAECRNIEPLRDFEPAAGAFEMIVPNLTNDMHDGSVAQGDAFLRSFVPTIIAGPAFEGGGVLFITFDEGSSNAGLHGDAGGHVATLIIASDVPPGYRDRAYLDHWALLHTTQELLGLPCLASTCQSSLIGH